MKRVLLLGCLLAVSISGLCEVRTFPVDGIVKPEQVYVSGERLYIVERVKITIYSLEDISEVASFGKEGEGPGEIRNRIFALYFREGEMIVPSAGKITFLTADGALIREIAMPVPRSGDICPVGKNFAGLRFQVEGKSFFLELAVFDSRGRIVRRLKRIHDDFQPGKGMRAFIPPTAFDVSGNTVISTFREDFVVTAFDAVGNERFTIRRDYPRMRVTEEHRQAVLEHFRTDPEYKVYFDRIRKDLAFPDLLPAIRHMLVCGDRIYIRTFLRQGGKTEFFIYATDGSFIRRVWVPLAQPEGFTYRPPVLFTFAGDTLYQLVEDSYETWKLSVLPLSRD